MNIIEKLQQIKSIIDEISTADEETAVIIMSFFYTATQVLESLAEQKEKGIDNATIDLSEKIKLVSNILGLDIKQLTESIVLQYQSTTQENNKEADAETLEFITSDLDDYEKFLAANKAKENLDFLKSVV